MTKLLLSLFALSSFLRADFAPQHWQFRTPIHVSSDSSIAQLTLNLTVCTHSHAHLNDLRVVRDGSEVPYELQASAEDRVERNLPLKILNKAVVPGSGLEATIDLEGHPQHNRVRIATSQRNFRETVRIETSDDRRNWSLVRAEALIFDISRQDRTVSDLTAEYPTSTRRYLRLTIPGWQDPALLESAWLLQVNEQHAIRDRVASLKPAVTQDPSAHTTAYTFVGFEGQPFDELELSVGADLFFRNVDVFTSNNGKDWAFAGATVVTNRPDDLHLRFQIPEQWNAYLKLVIANGDSFLAAGERCAFHRRRRAATGSIPETPPRKLLSMT